MTDKPLINRVSNSSLETINLEKFFPEGEIATFDIKTYLFKELILKEKDFRAALKAHDWSQYQDKTLLVYCSSNAIIPVWSYMLIAAYATPFATQLFQGNADSYYQAAFTIALDKIDWSMYEGKPVVIKGCSDKPVPPSAYMDLTRLLQPIARSIMYGEPCSTVPIYKRKRVKN